MDKDLKKRLSAERADRLATAGKLSKPVVTIDGALFNTLEGFYDAFQRRALKGRAWGSNLDAFDDLLRGGMGTPKGASCWSGEAMPHPVIASATPRPRVS
jgi:hypothetical protein